MTTLPFLQRLRRLLAGRRGVSSLVFASSSFVLVGAAALATDVSTWYITRRAAQNAADAAAAAGAVQSTNITTIAREISGLNGFTHGSGGTVVTVNEAHPSGGVWVEISTPQPPGLALVFGVASPTIVARARVRLVGRSDVCALALDGGLIIGGGATVSASGCALASNRAGPESIRVGGNTDITANSLIAYGRCRGNGNVECSTTATLPEVQSYAPRISNPFERLHTQTFSSTGCRTSIPSSNSVTLTPGVYCVSGGLSFGSNRVVTMNPGTYVIWNGGLSVTQNAQISCSGCTIIFAGNAASVGTLNLSPNSNGAVTLSAPTVAAGATPTTWSGILFYRVESANATQQRITIGGNSKVNLTGGMYFPKDEVAFRGNATAQGCALIVARTLDVTGNPSTQTCQSQFGLTPPAVRKLEFVE